MLYLAATNTDMYWKTYIQKMAVLLLLSCFWCIAAPSAYGVVVSKRPYLIKERRLQSGRVVYELIRRYDGRVLWRRPKRDVSDMSKIVYAKDGRAIAIAETQEEQGNNAESRNRLTVWREGHVIQVYVESHKHSARNLSFLAGEPVKEMIWTPDTRRLLLRIPGGQGDYDTGMYRLWCLRVDTKRPQYISGAVIKSKWLNNTLLYFEAGRLVYTPTALNIVSVPHAVVCR
jgi:hypothetical protein